MIPYIFLALLMTLTIILYKINKNKCRIHLTNTTDIKGGKNEKKIS